MTNDDTSLKFLRLYKERRAIYDQGKEMEEDVRGIGYYFDLCAELNKQDCFAIITEIRDLISQGIKPPFKIQTIDTIERKLVSQTKASKSVRWQLCMMMCDWMDVINDKAPRPVNKRTNIIRTAYQQANKLFEFN